MYHDKVVHYRMCSHLFGGVWCPSIATYALHDCIKSTNNTAIQNIILNSFYVDDCVVSTSNRDELMKVITDLKSTLLFRGFHITKFMANDEKVMQMIPEVDRSTEHVTSLIGEIKNKVLGVGWCVKSDSFYFNIHHDGTTNSTFTKAKMLSIVASIFDPLGLICPVTVTGMMHFQQANRLKINWKQDLPPDLNMQWVTWLLNMKEIVHLQVPRCIKPKRFEESQVELHAFCDASEKAYGCCFYIRCINR